jgi:hypothetical protein
MESDLAVGGEMPVGVEPTSTGLQPVAWPSGSSIIGKACPRQESNLALDLRRVACAPSHPEDVSECSHTIPRPGVEPGLAASKAAVPSATLAGSALARSRTWSATFGGSRANPSHSKGYESSSKPTAGLEPASTCLQDRRLAFRPRRQYPDAAGVQGFEPCLRVLEARCSPRSTPL